MENEIEIFLTSSKSTLLFLPKKWESSFIKNKIESDNAKNCDSDSLKNEKDNAKNFEQNMNLKNLNFNPAFMPHFFQQNEFCSQPLLNFQTVRYDKIMSRTIKLIAPNLGGRGYRFRMTLESKISRFKLIK